jgi:hypothetical protein
LWLTFLSIEEKMAAKTQEKNWPVRLNGVLPPRDPDRTQCADSLLVGRPELWIKHKTRFT